MIAAWAGMVLSFLLAWHGRDKIWTPTFEGDQAQRFGKGVAHYRDKMGIHEELVFDFHAQRGAGKDGRCASVQRARIKLPGFVTERVVVVRWFGGNKECGRQKPEYWALHEVCHLRMAHTDIDESVMTASQRRGEVERCMGWYSEKERR